MNWYENKRMTNSTPLLGGYTVVWAKVFTIVGYSEYIKEKPTDLLGYSFLLTR